MLGSFVRRRWGRGPCGGRAPQEPPPWMGFCEAAGEIPRGSDLCSPGGSGGRSVGAGVPPAAPRGTQRGPGGRSAPGPRPGAVQTRNPPGSPRGVLSVVPHSWWGRSARPRGCAHPPRRAARPGPALSTRHPPRPRTASLLPSRSAPAGSGAVPRSLPPSR